MELDIVMPSRSMAVEIGAWHWHRGKLHHDMEKHHRCAAKGIKLITIYTDCDNEASDRIPQDVFDLIESHITEESSTFRHVIGILQKHGIQTKVPSASEWESLVKRARRESSIMADMEFRLKIDEDIEPLEEYRGQKHIKVKCKRCQRVWLAKTYDLLKGSGCYDCKRKKPICCLETGITYPSMLAAAHAMNCNESILCQVINGTRLRYRGLHWYRACQKPYSGRIPTDESAVFIGMLTPTNIARYRCRKCGRVKECHLPDGDIRCSECRMRRTNASKEDMIAKLREVNPWIGEIHGFQGVHKPIRVRCLNCGFEREYKGIRPLLKPTACHGCRKLPIICLERHQVFPNAALATHAIQTSIVDILAKVGSDETAGGYHWQLVV